MIGMLLDDEISSGKSGRYIAIGPLLGRLGLHRNFTRLKPGHIGFRPL